MKFRVVASGLLVLALGALVLVWSSWTVRDMRRTAIAELQTSTERGAGQIANALRALELVMRTVSVQVVATGTKEGLQPYLEQLTARLPPIRTVTVISPDGEIRTDLRAGEPAKGYQVGDRAYFRAHFPPQAVTDYFYSPPIKSRLDGLTQITLSLAARGGNDDLIAVVVSSIDDRYFAELIQELRTVGRYDARILYKDGGTVYALHELAPAGAGHGFIVETMARLFVGSETVHRQRIAIPYTDLSFQLSLPAAGYMAQAAPLVVRGSLIIGLIILLLAMVLWLVHRGRAQIMESEKRFKAFAEAASDWFWETDAEGRIIWESESAGAKAGRKTMGISGMNREEIAGDLMTDNEWLPYRQALQEHTHIDKFEYRYRGQDGNIHFAVIDGTALFDDAGVYRGHRGAASDITERKQAEEASRVSEERLRMALSASNAGYWIRDVPLTKVFWSDENYRLLGYDPREVEASHKNWIACIHPDDRKATIQALDECIADGTDINLEYRIVHPDGSVRWIHNVGKPLPGPDGKINLVTGLQIDITDRYRAAEELRKSESSLAEAQRIAHIGNWDLDLISRKLQWSDEVFRIFHMERETFDGTTASFYLRVHPDDREFARRAAEDGLNGLKEHKYEYRIVLPDGEERFVQEQAEVELDESGKPIYMHGTAQDITERKRLEEIVKLSEERFRASFENAPVGNVVIDDTGSIEVFNAAAEEIFGYGRDEVIGRNVSLLMPELYHGRHDSYMRHYLETGDARIIGIGREVIGLRKNGEEFPMQIGVGEMEVGARRSFIGSLTDLTDIKTLERQLLHSQRMEAVGQLTGGVAHDFNNLLQSMIGNAVLLEGMAGENEDAKHSIEAIISSVERGASLTSRLLAFSRKINLSPQPTSINDLVLGIDDMLQRTLGETVELIMVPGPGTCIAQIDAHQFESALVNLAINARDAMPQGGVLTIETSNVTLDETYVEQHEEVTPGDYVQVAVSDTGAGIPPEALEKVFEPFFTTKEVGKGSGLGLSMVYGFAKQSKGHISIYSEVGRGTTVKLYMPRSYEVPVREVAADGIQEFHRGSERLLIVEDDEQVREISVRILRKQGYDVVEAIGGEEAVELLEGDRHFDLLFTDVVLPGGMNGAEIAEEAKRKQPGIKILFTSGYAQHAIVHNGMMGPGVALLSKPYLPKILLEKVRDVLDSEGD